MGMRNTRQAIRQNRSPIAATLFILAIFALDPASRWLGEKRWWRDLSGETPFYAVVVTSQQLTPEGLSLIGEMRKRRCEFRGLSAYVEIRGVRYRTALDTSLEDNLRPGGNRPPAAGPQAWGPWVVEWTGRHPERWSIWAKHLCQNERLPQENLFAKGDWP